MLKNLDWPAWDLKSRWSVLPIEQNYQRIRNPAYHLLLLEHEVTVATKDSGIELVATFVHALPQLSRRSIGIGAPLVTRGGLISLVLRKKRKNNPKRITRHRDRPFEIHFKAIKMPSQTCVALRQSPASPLDDVTHQHSLIQAGPSTEIVRMPSPKAPSMPSPQNAISTVEPLSSENLSEDAGTTEVGAWLRSCGFQSLVPTFATFSASDLLRLSRDDVIQICGLPDGIRLFNALHAGPPSPKLCLYVSNDRNAPLWRAVYLRILTSSALIEKLAQILQFPAERLNSIEQLGPQGIRVAVTDEVISHMRDKSMFVIETNKDRNNETYTILLKPV